MNSNPDIRKGVAYGNAEVRGRLRQWKNKLARNYDHFDAAYNELMGSRQSLILEMIKCPRAGRQRAFDKISAAFGSSVVLEEVRLKKRHHAMALWSILKPRNAVTVVEALSANNEEAASLAQDCVTVNYVLIGTDELLLGEGIWTLEVPDHALGRAVEYSRLLHPEIIIRDAHHNLLDLPDSALDDFSTGKPSGVLIRAGAGCFAAHLHVGPDISIDQISVHVRVKTWIDDDRLREDQIVLSGKGEVGNRLGDSWAQTIPASPHRTNPIRRLSVFSEKGNAMTREQAIPYISFCVDDALSYRSIDDMPDNARLVGWQCGFEPLFVAVWSYLGDTQGNLNRIDDDEAEDLATHLLVERNWFANGATPPDYII